MCRASELVKGKTYRDDVGKRYKLTDAGIMAHFSAGERVEIDGLGCIVFTETGWYHPQKSNEELQTMEFWKLPVNIKS